MKKQTLTIPVKVLVQDNQDGGYSVYAYNSEEELLASHSSMEDLKGEEREEKAKEILGGDDEYENGYISDDEIEIEIIDGVARLASKLNFHAGQ